MISPLRRVSLFNREEKLLGNREKRLISLKNEDIFPRGEIIFPKAKISFLWPEIILAGAENIFPRREFISLGDGDIFRGTEVGRMVYGVIFSRDVDKEWRLVGAF